MQPRPRSTKHWYCIYMPFIPVLFWRSLEEFLEWRVTAPVPQPRRKKISRKLIISSLQGSEFPGPIKCPEIVLISRLTRFLTNG